jgi:hypothetical protein
MATLTYTPATPGFHELIVRGLGADGNPVTGPASWFYIVDEPV